MNFYKTYIGLRIRCALEQLTMSQLKMAYTTSIYYMYVKFG